MLLKRCVKLRLTSIRSAPCFNAIVLAHDVRNCRRVDDGGAVNLPELRRVEFIQKLLERFAD